MDSDDFLPEMAIEKMVSESLKYASDLVIGQYQFINEAGEWLGESSFIEELGISLEGKAAKQQLSLCPPFPGNPIVIKDSVYYYRVGFEASVTPTGQKCWT